jgi:hypothetical protein
MAGFNGSRATSYTALFAKAPALVSWKEPQSKISTDRTYRPKEQKWNPIQPPNTQACARPCSGWNRTVPDQASIDRVIDELEQVQLRIKNEQTGIKGNNPNQRSLVLCSLSIKKSQSRLAFFIVLEPCVFIQRRFPVISPKVHAAEICSMGLAVLHQLFNILRFVEDIVST